MEPKSSIEEEIASFEEDLEVQNLDQSEESLETKEDDELKDEEDAAPGNGAVPTDPTERLVLATTYKEEGNAYFQSGKLDHALRLYRRGTATLKGISNLEEDEQVRSLLILLQTNLSMVCWKQQKYDLSKNVASQALDLESNNVKALYRRGMACSKLGELETAQTDFKKALETDPNNVAIKREYISINKRIKQAKDQQRSALSKAFSQGNLYADTHDREKEKNDAKKRKLSLYEEHCKECTKLSQPILSYDEWEKMNQSTNNAEQQAKPVARKQETKIKATTATKKSVDNDDEDSSDEELLKGLKKEHFRGYKTTTDGRTTSYFHRELSEEEKRIIGDITPKRLEGDPQEDGTTASAMPNNNNSNHVKLDASDRQSSSISAASVWNHAGTWEERDASDWCKEALKRRLSETVAVVADSYFITVEAVKELTGDASFAVASGRKKYIFDFMATLKFKVVSTAVADDDDDDENHSDIAAASGVLKLPDISSAVVDEGNYEVIIVWEKVVGDSHDKPTLEAELTTAVRNSVEQFVLDFNEHYS